MSLWKARMPQRIEHTCCHRECSRRVESCRVETLAVAGGLEYVSRPPTLSALQE